MKYTLFGLGSTAAASCRGPGGSLFSLGVFGCVLALGCGGSSGQGASAAPDTQEDLIERYEPIIVTDPSSTFNVTITTIGGRFEVDKLEIEFNQRRGIHEIYGFYRDAYDTMERIPFGVLERVDFLGEMPPQIFDQAILGRENENLRQKNAFLLRLTFRDQRQEDFYGIIPKFRGEKDLQLWEHSLNNQNNPLDFIEFDR